MPKLSLMNNRIPFGLPFSDIRILVIFIMSPRSYSYIILVENGHIQVRTPSVKFNHHCKSCLRRTLKVTTYYEHYYYFKCIDILLAQLSKSYCLIYMDLSNSLFLGRAQSILTFMAITSSALLNSLHFTLRQALLNYMRRLNSLFARIPYIFSADSSSRMSSSGHLLYG